MLLWFLEIGKSYCNRVYNVLNQNFVWNPVRNMLRLYLFGNMQMKRVKKYENLCRPNILYRYEHLY